MFLPFVFTQNNNLFDGFGETWGWANNNTILISMRTVLLYYTKNRSNIDKHAHNPSFSTPMFFTHSFSHLYLFSNVMFLILFSLLLWQNWKRQIPLKWCWSVITMFIWSIWTNNLNCIAIQSSFVSQSLSDGGKHASDLGFRMDGAWIWGGP